MVSQITKIKTIENMNTDDIKQTGDNALKAKGDSVQNVVMQYESPRGSRLHRYFIRAYAKGLCWNENTRKWVDPSEKWTSNCAHCYSLKSFRRMLRNNPHIVGKAALVNKYEGFNIFA